MTMDWSMNLFDLPQLCLDGIGTEVASTGTVSDAWNLLLSSKASHEAFSRSIYEHYDPGCTGDFADFLVYAKKYDMVVSSWMCPIRPFARDRIACPDTKWVRKRENSRAWAKEYGLEHFFPPRTFYPLDSFTLNKKRDGITGTV